MSESRKQLEGKVAIITGGASGIGEATARVFAEHGARMIVIADIQDDLGQQVAASIGADKCTYMHCDVSNEEQVKALVDSTVQKYDGLDIMFSNAGVLSASEQTVLDLDFSTFDRLFAVNVRGMAACVKHAARAMVEGGVRGSIVCTASVTGSRGSVRITDYHMSKHAVIGLVRSASTQLGVHGIRVNSVSPFGVATPGVCKSLGDMEAEEVEKLSEPYPCLKGIIVKAKHVADTVLFLASEDSAFVSGHDLVVDGGLLSKML
ncbi:(-)-isopiperitenol/(-)-carveol dehydrogenase, mitochondrial-like [Pistacia vera]|uniref:(-)-isopiperitenol/(-)-carveol dehydrogenase, mitochondrial-like n=1 Tax=Pistacia vera TaxID=55513 RepID=UPI00126305F4|nr:(-)-isopiperitenol/(-)-carveol dehydrogenase, mitochondrial-like [Pistacia vera]